MVVPITPVFCFVSIMQPTSLFVAAGLAFAASGAFAETGA